MRVYRNLSRHATWPWHRRSYQMALKHRNSKSTEQYDSKLFFRLDGTCNSMVKLSNSKDWDFESTTKFNASTGEEYYEWFVWGVYGTEVAFDIKQAKLGWLHSFLFFFSRRLLRMEVILPNISLLLKTLRQKEMISWSRTWLISWHLHSRVGKIAHILEQPNT